MIIFNQSKIVEEIQGAVTAERPFTNLQTPQRSEPQKNSAQSKGHIMDTCWTGQDGKPPSS
jgi:hypothetical protein